MRIVSKAELRKMPVGTLFVEFNGEYWPNGPDSIFLGDNVGVNDFYYCGINTPLNNGSEQLFEREEQMDKEGVAYPVDLAGAREGLYDDTLRYLVWDIEDVRAIVARTEWFNAQQGEWNSTPVYRIRAADGNVRYGMTDEEDVREMARPGDTIERLHERHEGEWRPAP